MRNIFEYYEEDNYLSHHGILGQKWGIRRFQNSDGTLTEAGKKHYGTKIAEQRDKTDSEYAKKKAYTKKTGKVKSPSVNDPVYKSSRKEYELRQKIYGSSKKTKNILDEVRKIRKSYIHDSNFDDKAFEKNWSKLNELSRQFREASKEVFGEVLSASGKDKSYGSYNLSDLYSDKAFYDDFWDYVYGARD